MDNKTKYIMYIHGFSSSGRGEKVSELRNYFKSSKIISPTLPVDPLGAVEYLERIIDKIINKKNGKIFTIGTSMGGFYSYYLATKRDIPGIQINPLVDIEVMRKFLGININFKTNKSFDWTEQHIERLKTIDLFNNENIKIENKNLNLFLSKDDELFDVSKTLLVYKNANSVDLFENGGHRFEIFKETLDLIEEIINRYQS